MLLDFTRPTYKIFESFISVRDESLCECEL